MNYPKIGIRPVIDGRQFGVRESLEDQCMRLANTAKELLESNLRYPPAARAAIDDKIMVRKELPDFGVPVTRVNYEDGCKVYFEDDSFIICRFSGTEPILRIFAEASDWEKAQKYIDVFQAFLAPELGE